MRRPALRRRPRRRSIRIEKIERGGIVSSWKLESRNARETDRLGAAIGRALKGGETLALFGQLGAGKTALVKGIAKGLGSDTSRVSSPTFVFINEYGGRLPLAHVDLYRTESLHQIESTGIQDYWTGNTVVAIEWADKGLQLLPDDRLEIELRHNSIRSRTVRLHATGRLAARLLQRAKELHRRSTSMGREQRKKNLPS